MLNETNITIDVARVLINSQTETKDFWALISEIIIPVTAIIMTAVTSILITYYTVTNNTRSIYFQANQIEIKKALNELSTLVDRGQCQEILDFLNSINGIYIPKSMGNRVRKKCYVNWLLTVLSKRTKATISKEEKNEITNEIKKYLAP